MLCPSDRKRSRINSTLQAALLLLVPLLYANSQMAANSQTASSQIRGSEDSSSATPANAFEPERLNTAFQVTQGDRQRCLLESSFFSVSKFDLEAPRAARHEYDKGVQLLAQANFDRAVEFLKHAIFIDPKYVAAHNALGAAYLNLNRNDEAENEFSKSVSLDNHLPYFYLNLGWAQLARKDFSSAEQSIQKAASLAPVDLYVLSALTYAQLLSHDYQAAIATARRVHKSKHEAAAVVHYFAAAAWQAQNNLLETRNELQTFINEAPQSPFADIARQIIDQTKIPQRDPSPPRATYSTTITYRPVRPDAITGNDSSATRKTLQQQLSEVGSEPESVCESCPGVTEPGPYVATATPGSTVAPPSDPSSDNSEYALHSIVNEVPVFFSATDHGKSVSDLTLQDVTIRDAGKAPETITNFRNEHQLPLRLGMVIDTSNSITNEFGFEQKAAESFLKKCLTDNRDQAFLVGFTSTVVLVKDFTGESAVISQGIDQLAPGGGTALWDAVKFAADKLGGLAEEEPVAKVVLVISDGDDNSSSTTLKEAIDSAEHQQVTIFTVSTRDLSWPNLPVQPTDRAMRTLAERTGGAVFFPDSIGDLNHRLSDVQQVIRSRYLISYKPAEFHADGAYRPITLRARKSGHKLRIYSRRGYYAPTPSRPEQAQSYSPNE
jgi:VWFA-related protein